MSPKHHLTQISTWEKIRRGIMAAGPRLLREPVVDTIRTFFKARGFREVETPLLVRSPGMEPYLEVFQTEWRTVRGEHYRGYLTTSPEYAMKKLLAAGIGPIFQICKSFRNGEEVSALHNPEFTILEWYRTNADYRALMADCEELFREIARAVYSESQAERLTYQGKVVDLTTPWERLSVHAAFERYAGVDLTRVDDLVETARRKGYVMTAETTWEQAYHQIFLNEIEPRLGQTTPTILYDYPIDLAALARPSPTNPSVAERFELYVAGMELANAFSELTDPVEQARRLRSEQAERRRLGKTSYDVDEDFIHALSIGIPEAAGIALGVDRLVMLFANVPSIRDVLWFPADELFGAFVDDG
ncbi:MAG TPA: EF-P lysine aminoacylase EpmA [Chloroflexota bacterium]|nr:EF-P lysine aminoacylase EpmA [Chloroflexota bacterium]